MITGKQHMEIARIRNKNPVSYRDSNEENDAGSQKKAFGQNRKLIFAGATLRLHPVPIFPEWNGRHRQPVRPHQREGFW